MSEPSGMGEAGEEAGSEEAEAAGEARPKGEPRRLAEARRFVRRGLVACMLGLVALAALYVHSLRAPVTITGVKIGGEPLGRVPFAALPLRLREAARRYLDGTIELSFGDQSLSAKRRDLGYVVDEESALRLLRQAGKTGNPLWDLPRRALARAGGLDLTMPVKVDRSRDLDYLTEVKDRIDRAALDARLDLEHHTIAAARPGYLLRVYDSLVAVEYAARAGATRIALVGAVTPAKVSAEELRGIDISTVLGSFETHYSASSVDSDRTYNLKVGADHLNGHILAPHQLFSFNEVVGDRTEKQGYRVAPVIQGGELIDGLAGGMCQIASTLHGAAFFAGLDIVSSTPHSRPSSYIPMGLDSTVVYPTVDLKLRNPYDFPVVMHMSVNQGEVKVELLGKARPYRVVFEREIKSESSFGTDTRGDPHAPAGQRYTLQEGYPGFSLIRRRYLFDAGAKLPRWGWPASESIADWLHKNRHAPRPIAQQKWALHYPATTHYVAVGTGSRAMKKKVPPPAHHIRPLSPKERPFFTILQ